MVIQIMIMVIIMHPPNLVAVGLEKASIGKRGPRLWSLKFYALRL